jgi:site-specific recombinase XerD
MNTEIPWNEAIRSFLIHDKAIHARKTVIFHRTHLTALASWAEREGISLEAFGKRHLDEYLVYRREKGLSHKTIYHDAVNTKVLLKWCKRNDIIERNPLADYEVRQPPKTSMFMPTENDMVRLLEVALGYWDPKKNFKASYATAKRRGFHRDRNYAIILLLLDSACRINEVLALKMDDYQESEKQITIQESKGRTARVIPVSSDAVEAISVWLSMRRSILKQVPKEKDEGWLFISETGRMISNSSFLRALKGMMAFGEMTEKITLHSLRRFSLNRLAKNNLMAAQAIAGHKDAKTTLIYTKIDPEFLRSAHEQTAVVSTLLRSKRADKRKRLV